MNLLPHQFTVYVTLAGAPPITAVFESQTDAQAAQTALLSALQGASSGGTVSFDGGMYAFNSSDYISSEVLAAADTPGATVSA
jgi:hypothetical protein